MRGNRGIPLVAVSFSLFLWIGCTLEEARDCHPGERMCEGAFRYFCADGGTWQQIKCEKGCFEGECVETSETCDPKTFEPSCASADRLWQCVEISQENRSPAVGVKAQKKCEGGICHNSRCLTKVEKSCRNDETCDGNVAYLCMEGGLYRMDCTEDETCQAGVCMKALDCVYGADSPTCASDKIVKFCQAPGVWVTKACIDGMACIDGACAIEKAFP